MASVTIPKNKINKANEEEVSTELILGHEYSGVIKKSNSISMENSIAQIILENREYEEERLLGISSTLKLIYDPWKIKKTLTKCDINGSCRLLLASESVLTKIMPWLDENRVGLCMSKVGMRVGVLDMDTWTEHSLVLKMWVTGSFVLTENWSKDFVKRRELKIGDEVGLYWDPFNLKFYFSLLRF